MSDQHFTRTLNRNPFPENRADFFNSASIGLESTTAQSAATKSFKTWNDLLDRGQTSVAQLFDKVSDRITFFHNTTAGIQRIFLRLNQLIQSSYPTLLTTDLEYPGIVSLVDETWKGRIAMVSVAHLINSGRCAEVTDTLKRGILAAKPGIVYLSHIARGTGYRIDETILDFIRNIDRNIVIIIDGAQACGNIQLDDRSRAEADFYVTSGHKWICGKQTLGIVFADKRWSVEDPAQSYSNAKGSMGTGNSLALLSVQAAVADLNGETSEESPADRMADIERHNALLAEKFSEMLLDRCKLRSIAETNIAAGSEWRWNGIVAVPMPSVAVIDNLQDEKGDDWGVEFTYLKSELWRSNVGSTPAGKRFIVNCEGSNPDTFFDEVNLRGISIPDTGNYLSRFCFHYYHNLADVERLVDRIDRARTLRL
ncbi:MAG TPA: aminotransferase class V-fold PLP-dependent enzyme [Pyrinomonadaceae bacterium]|nr:aminotransferase class V-fold PLP-dependent enzyme [Pyrinomonadaceae bacterium]